MLIYLLAGLVWAVFVMGADPAEAGPAGMRPHRALYEVTLASVKSGSQLIDIQGRMFFEWKKTCESWTTDNRSSLVYEYADGTSSRINSNFASYETLDGRSLDFSSRRESNGTLMEEFRGHATRNVNAEGQASYSIPDALGFTLPKNTFFPMQHTDEIIARARRGEKFFSATLFDGSDDQGPQLVNVFMGGPAKPLDGHAPGRDIDASLLDAPGHRLRVAFFPAADDTGEAEYEMDMVALDNGVVSDIEILYDTFTIRQRLVALQPIDQPSCASSRPRS